jgi:hypothetical protein
MKPNTILRKTFTIGCLFLFSHMLAADDFTCPSIDELRKFSGFYIEYPLSLDVQTQKPNSWLVSQVDIKTLKKGIVNTLTISPVKAQEGEYPSDASAKMIDDLELYENSQHCDDKMIDKGKFCTCLYWIPYDGSLATFVHAEYKRTNNLSPVDNIKMASKAMEQIQNQKK